MNAMTSAQFALCVACLFLGEMGRTDNLKFSFSVLQERRFIAVNTGDSVTLQCFYEGDVAARFYWYKLNLGQKPKLISTLYKFDANATFHDEFKSDPRFTMGAEKGKIYLKITELHISDSAIYYCASSYSFKFEFAEGAIIDVKGSGLNLQTLVQQSASETIQPGGSATLNCTVHTGSCDGEHSVYWFKDSEKSFPRIIYTHGRRNNQCERKPNTQTHTCVYNLPMRSLNVSHAGTYYCAVASCGHILFGEGTTLDFQDEVNSLVLMYLLSGALAFTSALVVLLAFLLYKIRKSNTFKSEPQTRFSAPSAESDHDVDNLHYAALSINLPNRSQRQRSGQDECVYSSVKH